jgi:hypothetical protein
MSMKALHVFALIPLAAAMLHGQPANGPVYWSPVAPDCTGASGPISITNASGATIGYSCYVAGTFVWLSAGDSWTTSIRVAAPASGPIGVDYFFYDKTGNDLSFDAKFNGDSSISSGTGASFSLSANQPSQINLLGATGTGPAYTALSQGSAYAVFYCANGAICLDVLPQLIYSEVPTIPWSLSSPIAWNTGVWTQWSAVGVDDGKDNFLSFAVYNQGTAVDRGTATAYTIRIYDSAGQLAATGTTPPIPPFQNLASGNLGQAGTYGALLKDVISTPLPSGPFKILIDGGSEYSSVAILQFSGASATTLQVAYDSAPAAGATAGATTSATAAASRLSAIRASRVGSSRPVFSPLPR